MNKEAKERKRELLGFVLDCSAASIYTNSHLSYCDYTALLITPDDVSKSSLELPKKEGFVFSHCNKYVVIGPSFERMRPLSSCTSKQGKPRKLQHVSSSTANIQPIGDDQHFYTIKASCVQHSLVLAPAHSAQRRNLANKSMEFICRWQCL